MITLQFSASPGFVSHAIRWFTFSDISHVDFVLPDGWLLGSHVQGGNGVLIRPPHYLKWSKLIVATVDAPGSVLDAAASQIGRPFDYSALVNFGVQRDWQEQDSWFCSELTAWSFQQGGYPIFNPHVQTWRITPRDLLLSPLVRY